MVSKRPVFSVIIPTYNWSSAASFAIRSVLGQTFGDFELLVVGDACTDDTELIVQNFGDSRVQWFNLPVNSGSQYGPNNFALARARGEYVAYLGHDDLWWSTHLEACLETLRSTPAEIVASVCIMYADPRSGFKAVTGLFPNERFTPCMFFPPSSLAHGRTLSERIGGWRSPAEAKLVVDYDFLLRCHEAGAIFASTKQLTVFKFNAAWRRDSYRTKATDEQQAVFDRVARRDESFREAELMSLLQCAVEDRLIRVEIGDTSAAAPGHFHRLYGKFKGTRGIEAVSAKASDGAYAFTIDEEFSGQEWHKVQTDAEGAPFRWSGPSTHSVIDLPICIDVPCLLRVHVVDAIETDVLAGARLLSNGGALATTLLRGGKGSVIEAQLPSELAPNDRPMRIVLAVDKTMRMMDARGSSDRRWVGLAVGKIEVLPITAKAEENAPQIH